MIAQALLWLIRAYQVVLSPFLGGQCRFQPSCSRYAYACIETHGAARGALLSMVRLCKCQPLHPGGYDPPPAAVGVIGAVACDGARAPVDGVAGAGESGGRG